MRLYHCRRTCALAPHIVLEETGAPYELYTVDINKDEHLTPAYLKVNPKGKVPALDVDGTILTENPAILYYLAKAYPDANLFPREPLAQAEWISLMAWISNTLHVAGAHVTKTFHFAYDPAVFPELQRKGLDDWLKCLGVMDERLEGRAWLMGEQYTTADAYLSLYLGGLIRAEAPLARYPNLMRWLGRLIERPAVRRALESEESPLLELPQRFAAMAA